MSILNLLYLLLENLLIIIIDKKLYISEIRAVQINLEIIREYIINYTW